MKEINWKDALLCADACMASYVTELEARKHIRKYLYNVDEYAEFSSASAEATCLKTTDLDYVIAFRGTDDISSVMVDLKSWQTDSDTVGEVHYGFKSYVDNLEVQLFKWLEQYSILESKKRIIVTGHSLGGAAATIFITRLIEKGYKNVCLYTFGSPRVGDKNWTKQFDDIEAYRIVNNNDAVTRIPPPLWFRHVGKLFYVNYKGLFVQYTWYGRIWDRIRSRIRALVKFQPFDGFYDHFSKHYRDRVNEQVQRIKANSKP